MKMTLDHNLLAWLNDTDEDVTPEALTEALDALYAAGPDAGATTQAQARLHRAVSAAEPRPVYYDVLHHTAIGPVFVAVNERGLIAVDIGGTEDAFVIHVGRRTGAPVIRSPERAAEALRQVGEYLAGTRSAFDLPVDLSGLTEFQRQVLLAAFQVPRGEVTTYGEIARRIGRPRSSRAVGQALAHNPVPIVIPCHRVLGSDGSLRGYGGGSGIKTKAQLLRLEGVRLG